MRIEQKVEIVRRFPFATVLLTGTTAGIGLGFLWFFSKLFHSPQVTTTPGPPPGTLAPSPPVTIPTGGGPIVGPPGGTIVVAPPIGPPPIPSIQPPPPTAQGPVTQYHVLSGPYSDPVQAQLAGEILAASIFSVAAIIQGKLAIVTGLGTDGRYYVMNAKQPPP